MPPMSVGIDWIDTEQLVIAYLPTDVNYDDIGEPAGSENADPRYRQFNELIIIQDVEGLSRRESGAEIASELSTTQGPDSHYKTAYVVSKAVDIGLIRIFNTYRGRDPQSADVFISLAPALDYLGVSDTATRETCLQSLQTHAAANGESLWF